MTKSSKNENTNAKPDRAAQGVSGMDRGDVQAHGWGPDVNAEHQEPDPSGHRSFHAQEYAPEPGPGRTVSKEETAGVPNTVKSTSTRGEDHAKKDQKGHHDHGAKGVSGRPSGGKDAEAVTGVDPQDPAGRHG